MYKVAIDIGHGGTDPGASGGGMLEKKINWNVAQELKRLLIKEGIQVIMTRDLDSAPSLTTRARIINANRPNLAVSIHHNAGGGDGFDVIYQTDPNFTAASKRLADCVSAEFLKLNNKHRVFTKPSTKNPKEDWYTLLALSDVPCVITELAFLDTNDVQTVDTLTEQHAEALAIFKAILSFLKW